MIRRNKYCGTYLLDIDTFLIALEEKYNSSYAELSLICGIGKVSLYRTVNKRACSLSQGMALARCLGVPMEELFILEGNPEESPYTKMRKVTKLDQPTDIDFMKFKKSIRAHGKIMDAIEFYKDVIRYGSEENVIKVKAIAAEKGNGLLKRKIKIIDDQEKISRANLDRIKRFNTSIPSDHLETDVASEGGTFSKDDSLSTHE